MYPACIKLTVLFAITVSHFYFMLAIMPRSSGCNSAVGFLGKNFKSVCCSCCKLVGVPCDYALSTNSNARRRRVRPIIVSSRSSQRIIYPCSSTSSRQSRSQVQAPYLLSHRNNASAWICQLSIAARFQYRQRLNIRGA